MNKQEHRQDIKEYLRTIYMNIISIQMSYNFQATHNRKKFLQILVLVKADHGY